MHKLLHNLVKKDDMFSRKKAGIVLLLVYVSILEQITEINSKLGVVKGCVIMTGNFALTFHLSTNDQHLLTTLTRWMVVCLENHKVMSTMLCFDKNFPGQHLRFLV